MRCDFTAEGLLFDLDGVLADSTYAVDRAWEVWSARHGIDPARAIATGHGRPSIEAIRLIAPELNERSAFEEMEELEASLVDSVAAIAGAPEFVQRVAASGIPWAVVTSGTRRIALPRLQRAGIPEPPAIVTADDVSRGKPDPEPYERAAHALGLEARQCVAFEDSAAGMLAARRAGACVVAIAAADAQQADASARDFIDVEYERAENAARIRLVPSRYRCACCLCHTLLEPGGSCVLCLWPDAEQPYALDEARANTQQYGVHFRPSDRRFAGVRHPVLGARGEYAIDRTALRERAYLEFGAFAKHAPDRAKPGARLLALLECIGAANRLYVKS